MRGWIGLLGPFFLLAACSGANPTPTVSPTATYGGLLTDALCQLVTIDEIQAATGRPAVLDNDPFEPYVCNWSLGDPVAVGLGGVQPGFIGGFCDPQYGENCEQIPGIGDAAFWNPRLSYLSFRRGSDTYVITFNSRIDGLDMLGAARAIALAALGRL